MWNGDKMPDNYHTNTVTIDANEASIAGLASATAIDNSITQAIMHDASMSSAHTRALEERVEKLEKLVDKLISEFMPEYKI